MYEVLHIFVIISVWTLLHIVYENVLYKPVCLIKHNKNTFVTFIEILCTPAHFKMTDIVNDFPSSIRLYHNCKSVP